jgi:hypothetical protein
MWSLHSSVSVSEQKQVLYMAGSHRMTTGRDSRYHHALNTHAAYIQRSFQKLWKRQGLRILTVRSILLGVHMRRSFRCTYEAPGVQVAVPQLLMQSLPFTSLACKHDACARSSNPALFSGFRCAFFIPTSPQGQPASCICRCTGSRHQQARAHRRCTAAVHLHLCVMQLHACV